MSTEHEIVDEVSAKISFFPKMNSIPRSKRAPKAIKMIKKWAVKKLKVEEENVLIAQEVNEEIWKRGIKKPPRYIVVTAQKAKDEVVEILLATKEITERREPDVITPTPSEPDYEDEEEDEELEEEF